MATPKDPSVIPPLYSCTQMASRIAARHQTTCAHTTVWTAIKRLKMVAAMTVPGSGYKFYTAEQEALIEAECRDVIRRGKSHGKINR